MKITMTSIEVIHYPCGLGTDVLALTTCTRTTKKYTVLILGEGGGGGGGGGKGGGLLCCERGASPKKQEISDTEWHFKQIVTFCFIQFSSFPPKACE